MIHVHSTKEPHDRSRKPPVLSKKEDPTCEKGMDQEHNDPCYGKIDVKEAVRVILSLRYETNFKAEHI